MGIAPVVFAMTSGNKHRGLGAVLAEMGRKGNKCLYRFNPPKAINGLALFGAKIRGFLRFMPQSDSGNWSQGQAVDIVEIGTKIEQTY
jgi:hypothetical protein